MLRNQKSEIRNQKFCGWLLALAACAFSGCVERTISITSEPAGALVHLNDEEVGRTPVVVPFTFYGKYDVRLERDGYMPLWTAKRARAPLWDWPGPDLLVEMLPIRTRVAFDWHFELEPKGDVDDERVLDRARQLRAATRQQTESE